MNNSSPYFNTVTPPPLPGHKEPGFVQIGMDAIQQNISLTRRFFLAICRAIKSFFLVLVAVVVGIILFPRTIIYYVGLGIISLIGAFGTRQGYVLIGKRSRNNVQVIANGLTRTINAAQRRLLHTINLLREVTQRQIDTLATGIEDHRLRRKVLASIRKHKRESYKMRTLHNQLDLLRKKKTELEYILEELIDETADRDSAKQLKEIIRREYEEGNRGTKI